MPKNIWETERTRSITHAVTTAGVIRVPKFIDVEAMRACFERADVRLVLLVSWPVVCDKGAVLRFREFLATVAAEDVRRDLLALADEAQKRGEQPPRTSPRAWPVA